jgi:glycine cleavage system H lipoate-binding protein
MPKLIGKKTGASDWILNLKTNKRCLSMKKLMENDGYIVEIQPLR